MNASNNQASSSSTESKKTYPQIVEKYKVFCIISGLLLLISFGALFTSAIKYKSPLLLGIDFIGGTTIEYKFDKPNEKLTSLYISGEVLPTVDEQLAKGAISQVSDSQLLILRTKELSIENKDKLDAMLEKNLGTFHIESVDTVSATIGPELLRSGLLALFIAVIGIMAFVSYRFRRDFAICTIVALLHDVTIVLGLFAILGLVKQIEVNSLFLTACLTVLGFSVHDTIVVFDRVRENMRYLSRKNTMANIINQSISQVWFRSFGTSMTLLFALGTLVFLGGDSTKIFAGAMFVGMLTGTYSSLTVAPMCLNYLNQKETGKKAAKK